MSKIKYCFVILNYNTYDYTINCISSIIEKCEHLKYKIIIVDNNSKDKSGEKLNQKYENDENIKIILNKENLGFAKGNNVGIVYARNNYNPDFIIVNNSDTLLMTDNFLEKVDEIFQKYNFSILGPKIHNPNNKLQYIPHKLLSLKQIKHTIIYFKIKYVLNLFFLTFLDLKYFNKSVIIDKNNKEANEILIDIVLHGSFLIFSSNYFKYYDIIPEDSMFYREEELLYLNCKNKNLLTLYYPELEIFHDVNGSIKQSYKNKRKQNLFKYKRHIIANKILYKKLKKN